MPLDDQAILAYITDHPNARRELIKRHVAPEASNQTVWRTLKRLVAEGHLKITGNGRSTGYILAGPSMVRAHLRVPYNRRKPVFYRMDFINDYIPNQTFYLSETDRLRLHEAGRPVPQPTAGTYAIRILERLLVDLSWASSRMEGNTYDILETERLIRFGQEVSGRETREAVMILNHKEAIQYVVEHLAEISISRQDIFNIHSLLSDGLLVDPAMVGRLRRNPVGIAHSSYRPLDIPSAIEEEFEILIEKAAMIADPFEQSFFILAHFPYLQAFDDVNKRTSRIASNIPLLKADLAPMSFLTAEDADYIDGILGIYELNDVSLLKDFYIEGYISSAENYRVLRAELESPDKAAYAYREFVRHAVRHCVLESKEFRHTEVESLAVEAGIPEEDREQVVRYVRDQIRGLHQGNLIRYRLNMNDLDGFVNT